MILAVAPLRPDQIGLLCRELQAMLRAGVPLDFGLSAAAPGLPRNLDHVAERLSERLRSGWDLSEAINAETALSPEFRAILTAGLRCGKCDEVLEDVASLSASLHQLREGLIRGMIYPLIIVVVALALTLWAMSAFLPQLESFYRDLGVDAQALSLLFRASLTTLAAGLVAFLALLAAGWWGSGRGESAPWPARWPLWFRPLERDIRVSRIALALSLLVKHGVPLPEALRLTAAVAGPRSGLHELARKVEQGVPLATALEPSDLPPFLRWLIVTGLRESNLSGTLQQAAEFYRTRAESRAGALRRWIPVALVILIGGGVTFGYALTIWLPMIHVWELLERPS